MNADKFTDALSCCWGIKTFPPSTFWWYAGAQDTGVSVASTADPNEPKRCSYLRTACSVPKLGWLSWGRGGSLLGHWSVCVEQVRYAYFVFLSGFIFLSFCYITFHYSYYYNNFIIYNVYNFVITIFTVFYLISVILKVLILTHKLFPGFFFLFNSPPHPTWSGEE